ncbi:MAG: hypothetical protein M1838_004895 [Thelocarpon superellum]|nr:MAG: hypothetical protein M1838_004895 [Thelocarpon superellum]
MATDAPDPKTFKTWDEAFQFPVPATRRMEQQLRGELTTNREKLRSLVGASYRDLLGTASRIIEMDGAMQRVEANLGQVSEQCSSRRLEKNGRHLTRWTGIVHTHDRDRWTSASLMAVLHTCPLIISRHLRQGESLLLAAKVLVLSRRLHRSLASLPPCPPLVEEVHDQLASLRRKLLRKIDRQLSHADTTTAQLVQLMCAFSLATSSSLTDVLKHFHHVRLAATAAALHQHRADHANILQAFRLYSQTLRDTQAVLPKPMMESLSRVKAQPLLQDGELRRVVELHLEAHERWLPDDIRYFIPWIGHEDLQKSEAEKLLLAWAKRAFEELLDGLGGVLDGLEDFRGLARLRRDIFETWFDSRHRVAGLTSDEPLQALRGVINDQLLRLVDARARRLHLVGTEMVATLRDWKHGISDHRDALWGRSTLSMDVADGATSFRKAVMDRSHGRNDAVLRVMASYTTWYKLIEEVTTVLKELREQNWDEDLEDDEDESGLASRKTQLSADDPQALEQSMRRALTTAFQALHATMAEVTLSDGCEAEQAMFLLRVLREIRRQPPGLGDVGSFGLSAIPRLHQVVARKASSRSSSVQGYLDYLDTRSFHSSPPLTLWDGSPPLPVLPSAAVFELLHGLVTTMAHDADIWSATAVQTLKQVVAEQLRSKLDQVLAHPRRVTNGNPEDEGRDSTDEHQAMTNGESVTGKGDADRLTQLLFDTVLLQRIFGGGDEMDGVKEKLKEGSKVSETSYVRVQKNASEYWKRTQSLFALLG